MRRKGEEGAARRIYMAGKSRFRHAKTSKKTPRMILVTRLHHAAAAFVVLLPVLGHLGDGGLAFTMYATTERYRLEIVTEQRDGTRVAIAPTLLARRVAPAAQPFFAGADNLRRTTDVRVLRARLHEVAVLACLDAGEGARAVTVSLFEEPTRDAPRTTRAEASCAR